MKAEITYHNSNRRNLLQRLWSSVKRNSIFGLEKSKVDRSAACKIRIDDGDKNNPDLSLALIIAPVLQEYNKSRNIVSMIPVTDPTDGPVEYLNDGPHSKERWDWIVDEMIWAFDSYSSSITSASSMALTDRRSNGFYLFGKYYSNLWT